jgi:transposase
MKVTTAGIDLAKNVFQVHGVDEHGKTVLKKQLKRDQMAAFFANLPPCLIGVEACGSAHHWARKLQGFGHTVKLMAPQFVKPYVKTNKNDAADAEAICEAVRRPNIRFVPVKNVEQQAVLAMHRVRQGFVKARTAQANQIRGLLSEVGLIIPVGIVNIAKRVPELIEDASNELPGSFRLLIDRLESFEGAGCPSRRNADAGGGLAPCQRGQRQTTEDSRKRSDHSQCIGGFAGRCKEL